MKKKSLLYYILALWPAFFIACNDTLDGIGTTIQPSNDKLVVGTDTLQLSSKTGYLVLENTFSTSTVLVCNVLVP